MNCNKCYGDSYSVFKTPYGMGMVCANCLDTGMFCGDSEAIKTWIKAHPAAGVNIDNKMDELFGGVEKNEQQMES